MYHFQNVDRSLLGLSRYQAFNEKQYFDKYFANLTPDVLDHTHMNYCWKLPPFENVQKVLVPINDSGDTTEFKQFRPSKVKTNYLDVLKKEIDSELDELLCDIWVPLTRFSLYRKK